MRNHENPIKNQIKFPIYQISLSKTRLKEDSDSFEFLFLEDAFYISKEDFWFNNYIQYQKFMDMRGKIFYIVEKVPVKRWYSFFWKRHCYEYVLQETKEIVTFSEFQKDLLDKLSLCQENHILREWRELIQKAQDFEDCISYEKQRKK